MPSEDMLAEAYRRGLLPPDKRALYEELQKRKAQPAASEKPGPFNFFGNIREQAGEGVADIERGVSPERIEEGGTSILPPAPLDIAKGAGKILTSPLSAASRAFGGGVEKLTGGLITEPQAETALMALGPRGGPTGVPRFETNIPAPALEDLDAAAAADYRRLSDQAANLPTHITAGLADRVMDALHDASFFEDNPSYAPVYRSLRRLQEPGTRPSGAPGRTTMDIESVRQELGHMARNPERGAAARLARNEIDNWLSNIPHLSDLAGRARGNYAAARRSEDITDAAYEGQLRAASTGSGANLANTLRQRIRTILTNAYRHNGGGYTQQELALMERIVAGDRLTNIARLASKLGPTHPLSGWGVAALGLLHGEPSLSLLTLGLGHASGLYAERATAGLIEALDEMTRMRSPLGQAAPAGRLPPVNRGAIPAVGIPIGAAVQRGRGTRDDPHIFGGTPEQMNQQFSRLPPGSFFINPRDNNLLQVPPQTGDF